MPKYKHNILSAKEIRELVPLDRRKFDLDLPEARFLAEYVRNGYDKAKAYIDAGMCRDKKEEHASTYAAKLCAKPHMREAIKHLTDIALFESQTLVANQVLKIREKQATFKITDVIDLTTGELKCPVEDIPDEILQLITDVEVKYFGKDADRKTVHIKFLDKEKALQKIEKHAGHVAMDKVEQTVKIDPATSAQLASLQALALGTGKNMTPD